MKINIFPPFATQASKQHGFLQVDLVVALAILGLAIIPVSLSFSHERQLLRAEYFHSAAMEIVDGEMEILLAGGWKTLPDGVQEYSVHSPTVSRLPAGKFHMTKTGNHLRLEWNSDRRKGIGEVVREITNP